MHTVRQQIELSTSLSTIELHHLERIDFIPPLDEYGLHTAAQQIGHCTLTCLTGQSQSSLSFFDIRLHEEFKGRNLGLAAYVSAIEQAHDRGMDFTSGTSVSGSALRVWGRLVGAGVAEVIRPPELIGTRKDGQRKYDCSFIVPVLTN